MIKTLLCLLFSFNCYAIDLDKKRHYGVSAGLSLGIYTTLRLSGIKKGRALYSTAFTVFALGVIKETIDNKFDNEDMAYNSLGIVSGLMIPIVWEF